MRVIEAQKMGFTHCVVPESNLNRMAAPKGIDVFGTRTVADAVKYLF
jgi:DNA repair protein RadA/Sms